MLSADVTRYLSLRRALGYKLIKAERHLLAFARFASERGESHVRAATVLTWLPMAAKTPNSMAHRLTNLIGFARFLHAEDPRHEIPPADIKRPTNRPVPYIYTKCEIARILDTAGNLRLQKPNPLRRELYVTLFGLIAATGLRISEALALRLDDILPDGVLHIRETKFRKSRLVPMHATVIEALQGYLEIRRQRAGESDWLFPSVQHRQLYPTTVNCTFRTLLRRAGIAPERGQPPRIHDLRHTFAVRTMIDWYRTGKDPAREMIKLTTWLGHASPDHTFWYIEAVPELLELAMARATRIGWEAQR